MAKIRHRIFQMYEHREEAISALSPKSAQPATETTDPESWKFKHFAVLRSANTAHVQFRDEESFKQETTQTLSEDLTQLADELAKDSRVLLDFSAVVSFNPAFIDALAQFNQKLKNKGSRSVICCLNPEVRQSFFENKNGHE